MLNQKEQKRHRCEDSGEEYDSFEDDNYGCGDEEPPWRQLDHLFQRQKDRRKRVNTQTQADAIRDTPPSF